MLLQLQAPIGHFVRLEERRWRLRMGPLAGEPVSVTRGGRLARVLATNGAG
jgi:hypothetical protein